MCETAFLASFTQVSDSEAGLAHDASPALQKAQQVASTVAEFGLKCKNSCIRSFLWPDTTNAATRWATLLDYRNKDLSVLKDVIHWCDNYEKDPTIPRTTSTMAKALLTTKTAIAFCAHARSYLDSLRIGEGLEAGVAEVESRSEAIRNNSILNVGAVGEENELAVLIANHIIPLEEAVKGVRESLADVKKQAAVAEPDSST